MSRQSSTESEEWEAVEAISSPDGSEEWEVDEPVEETSVIVGSPHRSPKRNQQPRYFQGRKLSFTGTSASLDLAREMLMEQPPCGVESWERTTSQSPSREVPPELPDRDGFTPLTFTGPVSGSMTSSMVSSYRVPTSPSKFSSFVSAPPPHSGSSVSSGQTMAMTCPNYSTSGEAREMPNGGGRDRGREDRWRERQPSPSRDMERLTTPSISQYRHQIQGILHKIMTYSQIPRDENGLPKVDVWTMRDRLEHVTREVLHLQEFLQDVGADMNSSFGTCLLSMRSLVEELYNLLETEPSMSDDSLAAQRGVGQIPERIAQLAAQMLDLTKTW